MRNKKLMYIVIDREENKVCGKFETLQLAEAFIESLHCDCYITNIMTEGE